MTMNKFLKKHPVTVAVLKLLLASVAIVFTLALIQPTKAVYVIRMTSVYSYIAFNDIGMAIIELALEVRNYVTS